MPSAAQIKIKWKHTDCAIRNLLLAEPSYDALIKAVKARIPGFNQKLCFIDNENDPIVVECDESMRDMLEFFEKAKGTPRIETIVTSVGDEGKRRGMDGIAGNAPPKRESIYWASGESCPDSQSSAFLEHSSSTDTPASPSLDSPQIWTIQRPVAHPQQGEMEQVHPERISRLALHPTDGYVGNFYDAKRDVFTVQGEQCQKMAHEVAIAKECIHIIGSLDEFNERFERLQVDPEQKLSVVSNLTESQPNGLAHFLMTIFAGGDDVIGEGNERAFGLVRIWHTKVSKLDFTDMKVKTQVISQQPLENATHVVKNVHYGYAIAAIFVLSDEEMKIEELKKAIQFILRSPNLAQSSRNQQNILANADQCVRVHIFADPQLAIPSEGLRLSQAIAYFAKCPTSCPPLPIQYELIPLVHLMKRKYLNATNHLPPPPPKHDWAFVEVFLSMAQAIKAIDQFYTKMEELMGNYAYCFSIEQLSMLAEKYAKAKMSQQAYYEDMQRCLLNNRKGSLGEGGGGLQRYGDCLLDQENISTMSHDLQPLFKKIKLAATLKELGVPYVGNGNLDFDRTLADMGSGCCFVFFCSGEKDLTQNSANRRLFFQLAERGERCIFVDLELARLGERRQGGGAIAKYKNGIKMVEDYAKEEERKLCTCIAKIRRNKEEMEPVGVHPPQCLVNFEGPCPKSGKFGGTCPEEEYFWECDDCGQFFAMENKANKIVDYFYCDCGRTRADAVFFRCKWSEQHGSAFVPFTSEQLSSVFRHFNFGELNILIMGESGVGKSTWINALANYMTYRNLDDALKVNNPICFIPSQFTIADEEMNSKIVQIGKAPNTADDDGGELLMVGKSATKQPKAHVFPYKGGKIRLIDTPGIGDTEGVDEDKENFAKTLAYISNLEELHGICILLKPNNARLSLIFRYCINELLSHLHKNAAQNILFCFTNARGTLYKPGDTLASLRVLLDEMEGKRGVKIQLNQDTVYCMDNEAFRFICAVHDGVKFDEKDHLNFAESWKKSESETYRLLMRVNSLPPHRTNETVSLNEARRIITTLSQPIAIIAKIIQDNISKMDDEKKRLASLGESEKDIRKKLMTPFIYINYNILPFPQTICASKSCTEMRIGPDGQPHIFYKAVCHEMCFLSGSVENLFPNQQLRWCVIFKETNSGNCSKCRCHWSIHMNTRYQQIEQVEMVEDPEVKRLLEERKDTKAAIKMAIGNAEKQVAKFEAERVKINEIAARFGSFLKRNAIMPYNDAIMAYVDLAIRDARRIAEQTKDFRKVEGLEEYLRNYKEQTRIIDHSLEKGTEEIRPDDIKRHFEELINLELMGSNIRKLFEAEILAQEKQMAYMENRIEPTILRKTTSTASSKTFIPPKSPDQFTLYINPNLGEDQIMNSPTNEQILSPQKHQSTPLPKNKREKAGEKEGEKMETNSEIGKRHKMIIPQSETGRKRATTELAELLDPRKSRRKVAPESDVMEKNKAAGIEEKIQEMQISSSNIPSTDGIQQVAAAVIGQDEGGVEDMDIEEEEEEVEEGMIIGENKGEAHPSEKYSPNVAANNMPILSKSGNINAHINPTFANPTGVGHQKSKLMANELQEKYAPEMFFPTFLNFCERTPDVKLQNGLMVYPWQSLPNDQINRAYDIIPILKRKFQHSSAANAAARSLILCRLDQCHGMPWGDQYAQFCEECPRGQFGAQQKDIGDAAPKPYVITIRTNPSPWALADFMNRFTAEMCMSSQVFTYTIFPDCVRAITEDIRLERPVLICYSVPAGFSKDNPGHPEWHYANVIALKCPTLLSEHFVLLDVDRTIECRSFWNLQRLLGTEHEEEEEEKKRKRKKRSNKYALIRFQPNSSC